MSMRRVSGWGALGGLVLSGILIATSDTGGAGLILLPVFGVAGAISAGGTLALARRAEHRDALESKEEKRALHD
jgi:hypothetical protein